MCYINPAKKETPHSFKGQQLENKLLYRFVMYGFFREISYNLQFDIKFITRDPRLAEIHDDLSENMRFQKLHLYYANRYHDAEQWP